MITPLTLLRDKCSRMNSGISSSVYSYTAILKSFSYFLPYTQVNFSIHIEEEEEEEKNHLL